ncbi:hypothetical protein P280DRAFT_449845 [Massarina eburnea CBS 473.64]|uniref:Methyltransferase-domain-containing protein n=1 Tax=Massarina eburnea CBS 473.64 TaxID=1395130 RepID=A0A6A6RZK9_9PLEO|nr:hypothetical protein P280DRAFT_449845 [Massarina eburnea CBS 473.64]
MDPTVESSLLILRRQYFQLVDLSQLKWPEGPDLKQANAQSWIFLHLFDTERLPTLPPERYRLRVLKLLISKLERAIDDPEEDELSDDLMSALSSLLASGVPSEDASAQQKAYVTYAFSPPSTGESLTEERGVTLLESRAVISSSGTTGLRTWEAALHLGAFLCSRRGQESIRAKRIFELGAGTGLLSILCAKHLGISGVVATDGDEAVVDAIKTNTFLNGIDVDRPSGATVRAAVLRWGWALQATTFYEDYGMEVPDVVLGADVTYDKGVIPALVSSLREFFELNSSLHVLIAATVRNEQTFETFLNACRRNHFSLNLVDFPACPEQHQDGPFYPTWSQISIWEITRPQPVGDPFAL